MANQVAPQFNISKDKPWLTQIGYSNAARLLAKYRVEGKHFADRLATKQFRDRNKAF